MIVAEEVKDEKDVKSGRQKYQKIFGKNKNLTIQEFVKKLKLNPKDPSYLKSITQEEAVDILLMIGLASIPFGPILKRPMTKKFGANPRDITFQKILDSVKSITLDDINDEEILARVKYILKRTNLDILEDPFKSKVKLKDYPTTKEFIRIPAHIKVAELIGMEREILNKLKEKIPNVEQFLTIENEQIANYFQIKLSNVQLIKDIISLVKTHGIKLKLAVILLQDFDIQDILSLNLEDIKNKIKNSKVKIQKSDFSDREIKKIKNIFENRNPKLLTLHKIISELRLKTALKKSLDEYEITSIDDFNKTVLDKKENKKIIDILSSKIKSKKKIELLKTYIRLNAISNNFELNKALIEHNFTSFVDITRIPLFEFQNKFIDKASKNELKDIYYRAKANLARNVTRSSLRTFTSKKTPLDYLITRTGAQTPVISSTQQDDKIKKEGDEH